jgi:predicted acyl esterase
MTEEKSPRHLTRCVLAGAAILLSWALAQADSAEQFKLPAGAQAGNYVGEDVYIPMRDGVKLHAEVWRPRDAKGPPINPTSSTPRPLTTNPRPMRSSTACNIRPRS